MSLENLFGGKKEIKSLSAIKGIAADQITAEQVDAVNAEFAELGFEGIEVAIVGSAAKATEELTAATDAKATAEASLEAANKKVEELTAKLEKTAGAKTEEPTVEGDKIKVATSENEEDLDAKITGNLKAQHGL